MSKIKEAFELLKKLDKALDGDWSELLLIYDKKDHEAIKQALAILRPLAEEPEAGEIDALMKTLVIYAETPSPVSQGFYQGLCLNAKETIAHQAQTIKDQADEIKDVIKFKDEIIKALNKRLSDLGAQC